MNPKRHTQASKISSYVRIAVSFALGLLGYLVTEKENVGLRIAAAYAVWSWFWGFVHLWPRYVKKVPSERYPLMRAYGFFFWGVQCIGWSGVFGILGGGIHRFIKELLFILREKNIQKNNKNHG